jgi:uncharacterized protein with von Willebrand factor type A (vWA) domain
MTASRNSVLARGGRLSRSLGLAIGISVLSVAAHEVERPAHRRAADCEQASRVQLLAWHHQQTQLVALDSLTGLLQLFATYSDELAAEAADRNAAALARAAGALCRPQELPREP